MFGKICYNANMDKFHNISKQYQNQNQYVGLDVRKNACRIGIISKWCSTNIGKFVSIEKTLAETNSVWSVGIIDLRLVFWIPDNEKRTEFILTWLD